MTPPSPLTASGSIASFSIAVDGQPVPTTFQFVSIETSLAVNRIPNAKLVLYDGSPTTEEFQISNLSTFLPGKGLTISLGYDQNESVVFTGIIVSQSIAINQVASSTLTVEVTDKAMGMTLDRKNGVFAQMTDSALITQLISNNGLTGTVDATTAVYEDIVQYYATDWDLMVMRAELNGFVVITDGGTVTVSAPNTQSSPVLLIEYGDSILDLNAEMNAATQYTSSAIKSSSWDESTQAMIQSGPGSLSVTEPGNISSEQLAKTFNISNYIQQSAGQIEKTALQDWSTAQLLKSKLSKIRGQVRFQGSALAKVGCMIQLAGLGDRFNGSAYVSAVQHDLSNGRWTTTATFGLAWPWFASVAPDISVQQASGQLPSVKGLQTGIVKQVATDPQGEYRVLVTLPILGANSAGVWARLSSFYASNQFGAVFYPEVNDELIVGFMNEDPRFPIILGSVYSKNLPPKYPPDAANNTKSLTTRSKLELNFDDQNSIVKVTTPGNRLVSLDDKAGQITISDPNKNTVTFSSSGIKIDSASDLTLHASGNISIQADGNLTMKASGEVSVKGGTITETATGSYEASGSTSSFKASGVLIVKGSMVNIN